MAKRNRDILREASQIGSIFQISNCTSNSVDCGSQLETLITDSKSDRIKCELKSKLSLLREQECLQYMPVELAYEEYIGQLPQEWHPNYTTRNMAVKVFMDSILNPKHGLPVVIVTAYSGVRYMMLLENAGCQLNIKTFKLIDEILTKGLADSKKPLKSISEYFPMLKELFVNAREKAIAVTLLALENSATSLRLNINIREDVILRIKEKVTELCEMLDSEKNIANTSAREKWSKTVSQVEELLQKDEKHLLENSDSLPESIRDDLKQNIDNRNNRRDRLKDNAWSKKYISRVAATQLKRWKNSLFSQKGKGMGKHKIDRGAEMAVYQALQEQLVAHKSRTGAPLLETRLHKREMRQIANKWLASNGKRLIKSYETVRSWGKPKNKRSIQSSQHRGKGLFSHRKAQKKYADAHINMHYNRAHIKHYTRLLFSNKTKEKYRQYALRRCLDDKAYLRCGTSEGFSRPKHKPVMLIDEQPELPSYDFPDKAGYIAPGVNLIISDMEELDKAGKDVYATNNVTISVTCKPKICYNSSSTNWANDMYRDRLEFPEDHEVPNTGLETLSRKSKTKLMFIKDSLTQFRIMNIKEDYVRCVDGGEFLEREKQRLSIMIVRLLTMCSDLKDEESECCLQVLDEIIKRCRTLVEELQTCECKISFASLSIKDCSLLFENLGQSVVNLLEFISPLIPEHKPIDIQTTDAGPGVGTSEKLVRLRMTESFIINDLDLQARFHYAPRDSKSHKVEQVMSALNEAAGDGRFIQINQRSPLETYTEETLLKMTPKQFDSYQERENIRIGKSCAEKLSAKYQGTACMFTNVNSRLADQNCVYQTFFFDEKYMRKCSSSSAKALSGCAGCHYYQFLCDKFERLYVRYNNGVEGIRDNNNFRCPNLVERVTPPIPDYSSKESDGSWHYYRERPVPLPSETAEEAPDSFCPIVRLQKYIESKGEPDIVVKQHSGSVTVRDRNETWSKISEGLEDFIESFTGIDLTQVVEKEAEKIYIRLLRKKSKQLAKLNLTTEELFSITTNRLKVNVTKRKLPDALPWNGTILASNTEMINTCTIDNMLFAFHVLQTYREDIKDYMKKSQDKILQLLYEIHTLFSQSKFAEGKLKWVVLFPDAKRQKEWNMWGAEEDFSFGKIDCRTTYTNSCTSPDCSQPVKLMTSRTICFSYDTNSLEEGIKSWFGNQDMEPVSCNALKKNQADGCNGQRILSERQFVSEPPLMLPLDISYSRWTKMPEEITVSDLPYSLFAVTYGSGGHFNCSILIQGIWHLYDGLREYHSPGTGLQKQSRQCPLPGYRQNHAIYVKNTV